MQPSPCPEYCFYRVDPIENAHGSMRVKGAARCVLIWIARREANEAGAVSLEQVYCRFSVSGIQVAGFFVWRRHDEFSTSSCPFIHAQLSSMIFAACFRLVGNIQYPQAQLSPIRYLPGNRLPNRQAQQCDTDWCQYRQCVGRIIRPRIYQGHAVFFIRSLVNESHLRIHRDQAGRYLTRLHNIRTRKLVFERIDSGQILV